MKGMWCPRAVASLQWKKAKRFNDLHLEYGWMQIVTGCGGKKIWNENKLTGSKNSIWHWITEYIKSMQNNSRSYISMGNEY